MVTLCQKHQFDQGHSDSIKDVHLGKGNLWHQSYLQMMRYKHSLPQDSSVSFKANWNLICQREKLASHGLLEENSVRGKRNAYFKWEQRKTRAFAL